MQTIKKWAPLHLDFELKRDNTKIIVVDADGKKHEFSKAKEVIVQTDTKEACEFIENVVHGGMAAAVARESEEAPWDNVICL